MAIVDINADLGEGFGPYKMGLDSEIIPLVTSVNIACGWHAGDPLIMDKTIEMAIIEGAGLGAHPSYPDLLGFGRRKMLISPQEARSYLIYQIGALGAFALSRGGRLSHVKLHGAFYNDASKDPGLADALIETLLDLDKDLILLALSGSYLAKRAKERGLRVAQEVFADRAYTKDGSLLDRKLPGALIEDENDAIQRTKMMVLEKKVRTIDNELIDIEADSICLHGDNPQAVAFAKKIKEALLAEGVKIKKLQDFI